jgi:hypothetical protein
VTRITWKYLNGTQTPPTPGRTGAVLTFTLPTTPGTYTLRFYAANLVTTLATSPTLTVPTPPASPSLIVIPTTVGPGGTVTATIDNGPGDTTDWVALYAADGTRLDWTYLNGTKTPPATGLSSAPVSFTLPMTPGTYTLRLHPSNGYTILASATVTVGGITFTAPTTATPGGTVTATLLNGPGNAGDWMGLYAADGSRLSWKYLNGTETAPAIGRTTAEVPFTLPTTAGTYTLRLYANYSQILLATTAPITVATPADTTITVTPPTTIAPGGTVHAIIANGPGNAADWVALYAAGGSTYLDWKYLNGTRTVPATGMTTAPVDFTLPTTPGTYTLQFYQNDSYVLLASSVTITVASVTLTADPETAAPGATVNATIASGPANATDWVALFAADGVTRLDWKYLNGSQTAPATGLSAATVPFTLPATPGVYTLRLYAKDTQTVLTSASVTVP